MNPHQNSNQNPATPSTTQQVNSVINQQTCNGNVGGFFPNNRPMAPPPCFMNFPNQTFPLQNTPAQFPNGIAGFNPQQNFNSFPVNQFNPSQQQGQFFPNNPMNRPVYNQNLGLPNQQAIMQNTIQNICQLLQLQNPNYAQCPPGNFPMFQNQIPNLMSHQNPGFLPNQQFGMPNYCGPLQQLPNMQQMANVGPQLQGNPFLPHASGSVQTQPLQNQIAPQNHSFLPNQMVGIGMANSSGPMQQQGFVSRPMMDVNNASRQIVNTGQQGTPLLPQNPNPTLTNFQEKHGNMPQHNNFTGDKKNDASHKGFKSQFHHAKHGYNGNMDREGKTNAAVNSGPRDSTNFEKKKFPTPKYTDEEIKQWREARKKHYPTRAHNSKEEETSILRCQQLKEILAKQAELGCEVADVPSHYLSGSQKQIPTTEKHERERFKRNKRGTPFQNDRFTKKTRPYNNPNPNPNHNNNNNNNNNNKNNFKPKERDPSLLQKLLTRDIKRDKNHLLQVFRFMAANAFFSGESLRFPAVIVRETGGDVAGEPDCAVVEGGEKAGDVESDEEEGEITD